MNIKTWRDISFWLAIIFIFFCICVLAGVFGCSTVKQFPKTAFNLATDEKVLDNIATISLQIACYYNAKEDRIGIAGDRSLYGASYDKWHYYKNNARFWLYTYGYCKGVVTGIALINEKNNKSFKLKSFLWRQFKRGLAESGIAFVIWQETYHYTGYGIFPDWKPEHNENRYLNPFKTLFGKDNFVSWANKPYIHGTVDLLLLSGGSYILIKEK